MFIIHGTMISMYGKFTSVNTHSTITNVLIDSALETNNIIAVFPISVFLYGHTYYILNNR